MLQNGYRSNTRFGAIFLRCDDGERSTPSALRPVSVGDGVSSYCSVVKAGDTSVTVKIETWARGRRHGKDRQKVTEGVLERLLRRPPLS
ncbi:hotdog domain-containing protein [Belnapia moabensis]|uniref:hotdog domain-containing protein n=1 Tax=Belnapia moabensis TaxID=365533 RepID=UPI0038CD890A